MKKKIIKSKMIRSDYIQVDCECGYGGLDPDDGNANGNTIIVGEDMTCPECDQVYHWGSYVGVKMALIRGK